MPKIVDHDERRLELVDATWRVNEARIVIPFWQKAVNDPRKAEFHQASMDAWLATIRRYPGEARDAGDIHAAVDDATLANQLLNMLLGAQIGAALAAGPADLNTGADLADQLDGFLALLAQ